MRASVRGIVIVLAVGALACSFAQGQAARAPKASPPPKAAGAYDRLDNAKLSDQLSQYQMFELLEEMLKQSAKLRKDPAGLFNLAQVKIALARRDVEDLDRRARLQKEAYDLLGQAIANSARPKDFKDEIARLRYEVTQVDLAGREMNALQADELVMLMGGQEHRDALAQNTGKVLKTTKGPLGVEQAAVLYNLRDRVQEKVEECNDDPRKLVLYLSKVQQLQEELRWSSGWIFLYAGMGSNDATERARLLNEAITAADRYAKGQTDAGIVDGRCLLLQGIAGTELGLTARNKPNAPAGAGDSHFAAADKYFKTAQALDGIEGPLRVQLQFQIARNLIEWGKYGDAKKVVDDFAKTVTAMVGIGGQVQGDVNKAMLAEHLYGKWALADKANAAAHRRQAQQAIAVFIDKYKANQGILLTFFRMMANKYRDVKDTRSLPPVIQFAVGMDCAASKDGAILQRARDVLQQVIDNKETSPEIRQLATGQLGVVKYDLAKLGYGENKLSAARDSAKSGGKTGLYNACIMYREIIEESRSGNTRPLRIEFVGALKTMLANKQWAADPNIAVWHMDLGEQYRALATRTRADQEVLGYLDGAIEAYNDVPATYPKMLMSAKYNALEIEGRRLDAVGQIAKVSKDEQERAARELLKRLGEYAKLAADTMKAADDKEYKQSLAEWGADAELMAAMIQFEHLGQKQQALTRLRELPGRWPDTEVLLRAKEYEIRRLIADGDTFKASDEIKKLRPVHPEQANVLTSLVMKQLQLKISTLRHEAASADYKQACKVYLEFSKDLLDTAPKNPDGRYAFEQMYADALLENGKAKESLEIFQRLTAQEQKSRSAQEKKFDDVVDKLQAGLAKARPSGDDVVKLAEGFPALLKSYRIDPDRRGYAQELKLALGYLREGKREDADNWTFRLDGLVNRMAGAYEGLRKDLRNTVPRDSVNISGLARANAKLKNYDKAGRYYRDLISGLDADKYPTQHWQAQLEYCQTVFDGYRSDRKAMSDLAALLREILSQRPEYASEFKKLELQARQASAKAK